MTEVQLRARKTWLLGDNARVFKYNAKVKAHGTYTHLRGYHRGDIQCVVCDKWINPDNPFEAIEIKITQPSGKRTHDRRYCPGNSKGVSVFRTVPRHHPARKRRLDRLVRY